MALAVLEKNWTKRALCAGNPDMWSDDRWLTRSRAAHICTQHCPVLADCATELEITPRELLVGVVVAGVCHGQQGKPIQWKPLPSECGWCHGR